MRLETRVGSILEKYPCKQEEGHPPQLPHCAARLHAECKQR